MSNQSSCVRNTFFSTLCIALLVISALANPSPAEAQDCQTALGSSTGAVELSNGDTTSKKKGVDEWNGEVVKLVTTLPGVLVLEGDGDGAQDSVYTQGSSTSHPLIDSAQLGTGLGELQAVVPAGIHCIQVTPGVNATGDFEVFASFTDVCHLGDCRRSWQQPPLRHADRDGGEPHQRRDRPGEHSGLRCVYVRAGGCRDGHRHKHGRGRVAGLYDSEGTLLDTGLTFQIPAALAASRYYVQVSGDDESTYTISVALDPAARNSYGKISRPSSPIVAEPRGFSSRQPSGWRTEAARSSREARDLPVARLLWDHSPRGRRRSAADRETGYRL